MCELPLSDEELTDKFRREYTDQFHILVRMHLSFVLDLNTDDNDYISSEKNKFKKWTPVPFNKKSKCQKGIMDGAPLTQEGICQVYQLIEFLKHEQNINVEGIFRRTGSLTRQQELRGLLNQGTTLDLQGGTYSIHDCASVLKGFLAELPDPLLTEAHYPAYCQIAELCGIIEKPTQEDKLLLALQLLLLLLPSENKILLRDILNLLNLTASHESSNRMSADNLAKLFTPHLLCPRKITPEQLHINSQNLCGIVAFMINNSSEIFKIPQRLLVDFRARYERRAALSNKCLNESTTDQHAANTVFTFVDQERTAKENDTNTTETALAQLYAHIQSLPESSKKRKLIKQFNKENGHGTPLQVIRSSVPKNRSFGDSIKKHIFYRGLVRTMKKPGLSHWRPTNEDGVNSPQLQQQQQGIVARARLFCTNCDSSTDVSNNDEKSAKKFKKSPSSPEVKLKDNKEADVNVNDNDTINVKTPCLTSTPACLSLHACRNIVFTPNERDERKSMSPITKSTQGMSKDMQETMMTPRSRKPVLLISGTNINGLVKLEKESTSMENVTEEFSEENSNHSSENNIISSNALEAGADNMYSNSFSNTFREYLSNRSMLTTLSPAVDSSFSSRTDDFNSTDFNNISDDKMSDSLLYCLNNGHAPDDSNEEEGGEKKLVLKPKQFDENGHPIIFETSF